ncbi:Uncharacterised protein [Mycolicibacterium fortuitum]|uniref:Uncharacterized protein n=1 Tax=Mycolicibacterium fortuitum TaxID=1766 RepID=A0A378V0J9_MYCFO|nr:Uncharacterised protein [Mycolicibacterium fortuitum]
MRLFGNLGVVPHSGLGEAAQPRTVLVAHHQLEQFVELDREPPSAVVEHGGRRFVEAEVGYQAIRHLLVGQPRATAI